MRVASADAADIRQRAVREDSDIIVALIRTAFIIAYLIFRYQTTHTPLRPLEPLPEELWRYALWLLDSTVKVGAVFNLLLLVLYLRGFSLRRLRPVALLVDLVLIGIAITVFRQTGYDAFDLYYLVIIPAAVWYRRAGAVTVAVLATIAATVAPRLIFNLPYPAQGPLQAALEQGLFLLLIAVIAGYMIRARDAEHLSMMELRQEMRLARILQSRMLPSELPQVPRCDLGVVFTPARLVGGDFYDLRLLDSDHLLIVLADMSGKSVHGLVHLSLLHSHLQAALREGCSPGEAARSVNEGTYQALQPESYAALFIGILRLSDGLLTFVNCGHVPPLIVSGDRQATEAPLSTDGAVIGALPGACYTEAQMHLQHGDTLICFSDGISETRSRKKELFGEERVAELVRQHQDAAAQTVADALVEAANRFSTRRGQDDITVIAVRRLEADAGAD